MESPEQKSNPWPGWIWMVLILFPLPLRRGHWFLGLFCFLVFALVLFALRHPSD